MIPQEGVMKKWSKTSQMYLTWIIEGSIQFASKQNAAFRRAPATLIGGSQKNKSNKLFIFYIFRNNTSYCSVSLYYKYIGTSAKHNIFCSCLSSVKRSLNFQSSHLTKKETEDALKRLSRYCTRALNWRNHPWIEF